MAGPIYINQDVINKILAAGIDPKTGLLLRAEDCNGVKSSIKAQLRIIDEQDAVNRYMWYNLPLDISSQELERLLYYRGQLYFFYFEELGKFFVMPGALDGDIDFYGRFLTIHPIPIAEGKSDAEKQLYNRQRAILSNKKLKVLYDIPTEPLTGKLGDYCVPIYDYTKQLSQTILPRQQLQEGLLDVMSDCIPLMNTALYNSTGIQGMRVSSESEQSNVAAANATTNKAALNKQRWIPVVGLTEFQDLTNGSVAQAEQFLMAMQSLDNFRLSTYGLENGGLFEKKQYQNNMQTMLNGAGQIGRPLQDGLSIRQKACDIINVLTGAGVSVELTETAAGMDLNMDGLTGNTESTDNNVTGGEQDDVE